MIIKIFSGNFYLNEKYKDHKHYHNGDSGIDLYFPQTVTVEPGETKLIDLEIVTEPDRSFYLLPRSSIVKTPLRMSNSIGLIDKMYRGNIKVCVDNIKSYPYTIEKGDRLFQIVAPTLNPIFTMIESGLGKESGTGSETNTRNEGGFGSTGK